VINFKKTTGLKNFSKRNINSIDGVTVNKIKKLLFQQSPNKFFPNSWGQGTYIYIIPRIYLPR